MNSIKLITIFLLLSFSLQTFAAEVLCAYAPTIEKANENLDTLLSKMSKIKISTPLYTRNYWNGYYGICVSVNNM